jgi:putative ATP-binding cassette transporter
MAASGRRIWGRFVRITRPVFASPVRGRVTGLLVVLVMLLAITGLNVVNSYVGRDFMTALSEREAGHFFRLALAYGGVFFLSTLVAVFQRFTEESLGLFWRRWMTEYLTEQYLSPTAPGG